MIPHFLSIVSRLSLSCVIHGDSRISSLVSSQHPKFLARRAKQESTLFTFFSEGKNEEEEEEKRWLSLKRRKSTACCLLPSCKHISFNVSRCVHHLRNSLQPSGRTFQWKREREWWWWRCLSLWLLLLFNRREEEGGGGGGWCSCREGREGNRVLLFGHLFLPNWMFFPTPVFVCDYLCVRRKDYSSLFPAPLQYEKIVEREKKTTTWSEGAKNDHQLIHLRLCV